MKLDGEKLWKYYDAMVVKKVSPPPEQMDARALTSYLALLDDIEEGLIREQAQQKPNVKKHGFTLANALVAVGAQQKAVKKLAAALKK